MNRWVSSIKTSLQHHTCSCLLKYLRSYQGEQWGTSHCDDRILWNLVGYQEQVLPNKSCINFVSPLISASKFYADIFRSSLTLMLHVLKPLCHVKTPSVVFLKRISLIASAVRKLIAYFFYCLSIYWRFVSSKRCLPLIFTSLLWNWYFTVD